VDERRQAPSNFLAINAEAQKKAIDTQGESIAKGMQHLLNDISKGHVSHDRRKPVSRWAATWPPPKARWCSRTSCSS
jgi:hypothetical protein